MKFTSLIPRYLRLFRTHLKRLCQQSTVPGLNYFVDPSIPVYQRSMFGLLMLCATGFTIFNMVMAYNYSQDHYVITNIETLQFPLWNLTYPAVHICNLNRISLRNLNKVMDKWIFPNNMTRKEAMKEMRTLPVLAFKMKLTNNYNIIYRILSMNNVSLSALMNQLSDSCSDYLKACRWWKKDYRCDQLFSKTVSVDGYCCSFNSFTYHSRQDMIFRKARIATSCSYSDNLIVTMETNQSDYFSSLSSSFGFAVYLKNPYLYPDSSEIGKLSPFNMVILISFLAKKVFSTDEVKEISEKYRDCSSSGRPLAAFQTYSYHNCIVECRINLTLRLCNCVPLIFPFTSDGQRRCGIEDIPCLHQYSEILQAINHGISAENSGGQTEFQQKNLLNVDHVKKRPCNCLPDCSRTLYEADAVYSPLVQRKGFRENRTFHHLYVYAQDVISTRIRRDTFYTWSVLLGTYGGLLGFFLGLSIICFSEIFYFAILQPLVVLLKTKFFSCNDINNPSDSSAVVHAMFVASVENESRSIKQQTNVERYNNRLIRAAKHSKTKMVFQKRINQEWIN